MDFAFVTMRKVFTQVAGKKKLGLPERDGDPS
jgi:hypothetical protein